MSRDGDPDILQQCIQLLLGPLRCAERADDHTFKQIEHLFGPWETRLKLLIPLLAASLNDKSLPAHPKQRRQFDRRIAGQLFADHAEVPAQFLGKEQDMQRIRAHVHVELSNIIQIGQLPLNVFDLDAIRL